MSPAHADALVETAHDGVAFDGLRVAVEGDGYRFETAEATHRGLDETRLRELACDSPAVRNWHFWHAVAPQREDHWTFLRWLEGLDEIEQSEGDPALDVADHYESLADGIEREWGQVQVTVTLAEGRRRYSLRHVDDAGVDGTSLDRCEDPGEARKRARFDDRGRYRPLKTAPTLQTGWQFPALGPATVLEALGYLYPATVENWYRERTGSLDVTHWHEAVSRQTGMYSVVETWDRGEGHDHVEWVAETCCVDSQCLKRRRWEYDAETPLDTDGGDGQFPCREPCSLVISAAREWTRLEGEASHTYEFDLTPSEKEQLEAVIEAVADGRADDVREADFGDDTNRWRVRFLRAKLFDDEGRLCGVPTDRP